MRASITISVLLWLVFVVLCQFCCVVGIVLCTTEPPYKTTWWRTVSIYLNICSMCIKSKEQISMWTRKPLNTLLKHAQTYSLSLSLDSYLDNTLPVVCVLTAEVLSQQMMITGSIVPKTNACCGFYYSYNVFSPLMYFSVPFLFCQTSSPSPPTLQQHYT